jgi:hypothetical protein
MDTHVRNAHMSPVGVYKDLLNLGELAQEGEPAR